MELIEFIIFLSLNIILLAITLIRKGALFSLIGLLSCLFILPLILSSGLVLDRIYVTNSTGIVESQAIYANITLMMFFSIILFLAHAVAIIRGVRSE